MTQAEFDAVNDAVKAVCPTARFAVSMSGAERGIVIHDGSGGNGTRYWPRVDGKLVPFDVDASVVEKATNAARQLAAFLDS